MNAKVHLLLDIVDEDCGSVVRRLSGQPGVVTVDMLEGKPNLIVTMEATDRHVLAELMMPLMQSIENSTEDLHLLVNKEPSLPQLN